MLSFLEALLGHSATKQPYLCAITYRQPDGSLTQGSISLWAEDLRDALQQLHGILPAHQQATRAVLHLREDS